MNRTNSGVGAASWIKRIRQRMSITNPNMKTADVYIQALQETTMTLIDSILMPAGPKFRKSMREELKANPGAN